LIAAWTNPGEVVLDCFNGVGTTTLVARDLNRRYIGIELDERYHHVAELRHREIEAEAQPFRTYANARTLSAKNSWVPRMPRRSYAIPKKTLQLEVKRVAKMLDRLPTRQEMIRFGKYPIRYYDEYFVSWGEVCAAARTTGMSETRTSNEEQESDASQSQQLEISFHSDISAKP
jgi:site-specific DNA-methyltransferase (adenine-specific)